MGVMPVIGHRNGIGWAIIATVAAKAARVIPYGIVVAFLVVTFGNIDSTCRTDVFTNTAANA